MSYTRLCAACDKEFTTDINMKTREKLRKANNVKYAEIPDIPTRVICGWNTNKELSINA